MNAANTYTHQIREIPRDVLLPSSKPLTFHRINIEYYALINHKDSYSINQAMVSGIHHNLRHVASKPDQLSTWQQTISEALEQIGQQMNVHLERTVRQLPLTGLIHLPNDTTTLCRDLGENPTDYLRHFHLGWQYQQTNSLQLAERHFNVASLQSQLVNPSFAGFAFRHLADIRYRRGKWNEALAAIQCALHNSQKNDPELHYEMARMLCKTQHTTQALQQLIGLIKKHPEYLILALHEPDWADNPSIQRFLVQRRQHLEKQVKTKLARSWNSDPVHLLEEQGVLPDKKQSGALRYKQALLLRSLPDFMLYDTDYAAKQVQHRSRSFVKKLLDTQQQRNIEQIETHQESVWKIRRIGQWMLYAMVVLLLALAVSHGLSYLAQHIGGSWPVIPLVKNFIIGSSLILGFVGALLQLFTPHQLERLQQKKEHLFSISQRLG